jgi:hypothetical protein
LCFFGRRWQIRFSFSTIARMSLNLLVNLVDGTRHSMRFADSDTVADLHEKCAKRFALAFRLIFKGRVVEPSTTASLSSMFVDYDVVFLVPTGTARQSSTIDSFVKLGSSSSKVPAAPAVVIDDDSLQQQQPQPQQAFKVSFGEELRRFRVSNQFSLEDLLAKLATLFPTFHRELRIQYDDW